MFTHARRLFPLFLFETPGAGAGTPAAPAAPPPTAAPAGGEPPAGGGPAAPAPATPPAEQAVPYERFQAVNTKAQQEAHRAAALEQERDQLKAQITAQQRAGLPELDQIKAQLAETQTALKTVTTERDTARAAAQNLERGAWVRQAAAAANFHDPEDAVLRTDLATIDSQEAATRHVQTLAASDTLKHLIRPTAPALAGGDLLQRVLRPAATPAAGGDAQERAVLTTEQFNGLTTDQHVALQEKDPAFYERCLRAAAQ